MGNRVPTYDRGIVADFTGIPNTIQRSYRGTPYGVNTAGPGYYYGGQTYGNENDVQAAIEKQLGGPPPTTAAGTPLAGGTHRVNTQGQHEVWDPNKQQWLSWMGSIPTGAKDKTTGTWTPQEWDALNQADVTNAADVVQKQKDLATQSTNRTLNLLRQSVGMNEQQGEADLRRELASRGLLDSGSLGAGVVGINAEGSRQLEQGTQAAAQGEGDRLMGILSHSQDLAQRQHEQSLQNSWAQMQFQNNINQFYQQMGLERDRLSQQQQQFYDSLAYQTKKDENDTLMGYLGMIGKGAGAFLGSGGGAALLGVL